MAYLLKSALLVTLDQPAIELADIRIEGGRITERGAGLEPRPGDETIDLGGSLVMPGMVCAHTHLYSALARGMPAPPRVPSNFREILELIWWRLDLALDEETIYWSAMAGALDAARTGTTCLFDHHASPSHITGSLDIVREAVEKVGLRGVLCYEVTDRGGDEKRDEGLEESRAFLESIRSSLSANSKGEEKDGRASLFRGMVGAHASFTLTDSSLGECAELMREYDAGIHIHVAEDRCDTDDARSKYGIGPVERLDRIGAINDRSILAHGVHLSERDIEIARSHGVWFAHNPRSNMNNQVGYAPVTDFGNRVVIGTDGIGADMFEEARVAFFKGRDEHTSLVADDWMRALANNQRIASNVFGVELGSLAAGAAADLIVLDYQSPTPVTADNLAWHLAFGLSSASVRSVMVNGKFIIRDRLSPVDNHDVYGQIRKASEKLWGRLKSQEF
jgi:putative selenium metabolism protein SsnA